MVMVTVAVVVSDCVTATVVMAVMVTEVVLSS